jgi:hypothetical protein
VGDQADGGAGGLAPAVVGAGDRRTNRSRGVADSSLV